MTAQSGDPQQWSLASASAQPERRYSTEPNCRRASKPSAGLGIPLRPSSDFLVAAFFRTGSRRAAEQPLKLEAGARRRVHQTISCVLEVGYAIGRPVDYRLIERHQKRGHIAAHAPAQLGTENVLADRACRASNDKLPRSRRSGAPTR